MLMSMAVLFKIALNRKWSKCSSKAVSKLWYIFTKKYNGKRTYYCYTQQHGWISCRKCYVKVAKHKRAYLYFCLYKVHKRVKLISVALEVSIAITIWRFLTRREYNKDFWDVGNINFGESLSLRALTPCTSGLCHLAHLHCLWQSRIPGAMGWCFTWAKASVNLFRLNLGTREWGCHHTLSSGGHAKLLPLPGEAKSQWC